MENKPNNEISELLARLQKKVEKKSEPAVDSVKPMEEESTEALLSLLKKNIGIEEEKQNLSENQEYNIEGYEFEEENLSFEEEKEEIENDEEISISEITREEEILHSRVEMLVSDSVVANEGWELPKRAENTPVETARTLDEEPEEEPAQNELNTAASMVEEDLLSENEETPYELPKFIETDVISEIEDEAENQEIDEFIAQDTPLADTSEDTEDLTETKVSMFVENASMASDTEVVLAEINEKAIEWEEIFETEGEDIEWKELVEKEEEPDDWEELEGEYTETYLSEPSVKRFFRFRRLKHDTDDGARNELLDTPDFDDVDINLALALGSKEALENSIGYSRVRSAKNGFYDPFWEEATGDRTYGYGGEEFRSYEQTESIKKRYSSEYHKTVKRFIATFILAILILFLEHLPMTSLRIPYLSEWLDMPIFYYGVAVLLSALLILFSFRKILCGLRSLFCLHGEPFVPVACLSVLNFVYNLVSFLFLRESAVPVYNFAIAVFLLFGIADDGMRLTREKLSFDVVSNQKPKLSLEEFEGNVQVDAINAFFAKKDFFVEKVDFVGNFFSRSGRRPVQFSEYFHELAFSALGSLFISLFSVYLTGDVSIALTSFVFSMFLCVPMQFLTISIYPFFHLTKGLSKLESAVIGDAVTEEYNDADTIYLEDAEMFGKHGARIAGLRVYNDMDFYELLSYALSVFTVIGAPLCNVFDNSAKEIIKKENVKITNISVGGVEAVVDLKTVYIGDLAFMRSRGYFPKRNADDEKKTESGQISILYMAIGGELCAKLYMQYTVTQRFEKFAAEMLRNGIHVGIRTLDPNVNEKMIAALRNDKDVSIKVIRPTPNELIPIGKHSESGIVTSKNPHMIFKILEQCFNIKRIHAMQRKFRILSLLLGMIISVLVMTLKWYTNVPSLYIVIYQLIWLLPSLIYTKSNLK